MAERKPAVKTPWREYSKQRLRSEADDITNLREGRKTLKEIASDYWGRAKARPAAHRERREGAAVAKREQKDDNGNWGLLGLLGLLGLGYLWWRGQQPGDGTNPPPGGCPAGTHWDNTLGECVPDGGSGGGVIALPNGGSATNVGGGLGATTPPQTSISIGNLNMYNCQLSFIYTGPQQSILVDVVSEGSQYGAHAEQQKILPAQTVPRTVVLQLYGVLAIGDHGTYNAVANVYSLPDRTLLLSQMLGSVTRA